MTFLDYFPSKFTPREDQVLIINQIEEAINSGFNNIILCAPTGIGKSHVATTISRSLGSSFTITGQKILQSKYVKDFPWIYDIKGKNNFLCLDLWDSEKLDFDNAFLKKDLRCNNGNCTRTEIGDDGKPKITHCEYKPTIEEYSVKNFSTESETVVGPKDMCYYYDQKYKGLNASHTIFNYASFFQTIKFSGGFEDLLEKKCLIADEAHEIEEQIIAFIGFDIYSSYLKDSSLKFSDYKTSDNDGVLSLLTNLGNEYKDKISKLEKEDKKNDQIPNLKTRLSKFEQISQQLKSNSHNLIVQEELKSEKIEKITIKPIEIADYTKQFFDFPLQLFMSATINKEIFCDMMGFSKSSCSFIEVPKSPFDIQHRIIEFKNIRWLSRNSTTQDYQEVYKTVEEILKIHENEKGLILTSSNKQCNDLLNSVSMDSWSRLKIVHSDLKLDREQILENHKNSTENDVLVSPSLWYGIDLEDDLSRFQIIIKTPYPNYGDKRVKIKTEKNQQWYDYATLVKLLQGFGRSIRNENDYAKTYVLDGQALNLIKKMKDLVPKSYYDILPLD